MNGERAEYGTAKAERMRRRFFARSRRIEKANQILLCPRCNKWSKRKYWPSARNDCNVTAKTCCKRKDLEYNRRLKQHGLKKCWICNEIKDLGEFGPHKTRGGESGNCRDCIKASKALKASRERRQSWIEATDDGSINSELLRQVFAQCAFCPVCSKKMKRNEKHLDHKVPLSRGGKHSASNVWVLCADCNLSKGSKTVDEWLNQRQRH